MSGRDERGKDCRLRLIRPSKLHDKLNVRLNRQLDPRPCGGPCMSLAAKLQGGDGSRDPDDRFLG